MKSKKAQIQNRSQTIQRSQSTQSKHHLPSLREDGDQSSPPKKANDYVNTEIIKKFMSSENLKSETSTKKKKHVCAIKIGGDAQPEKESERQPELPKEKTSKVIIKPAIESAVEAEPTKPPRSLTPKVIIKDGTDRGDVFVPEPETNKGQIQVLVSSNSNNPKSESRKKDENQIQNQTKFKSLGDLHMEKGLPATPRYGRLSLLKTKINRLSFHL